MTISTRRELPRVQRLALKEPDMNSDLSGPRAKPYASLCQNGKRMMLLGVCPQLSLSSRFTFFVEVIKILMCSMGSPILIFQQSSLECKAGWLSGALQEQFFSIHSRHFLLEESTYQFSNPLNSQSQFFCPFYSKNDGFHNAILTS